MRRLVPSDICRPCRLDFSVESLQQILIVIVVLCMRSVRHDIFVVVWIAFSLFRLFIFLCSAFWFRSCDWHRKHIKYAGTHLNLMHMPTTGKPFILFLYMAQCMMKKRRFERVRDREKIGLSFSNDIESSTAGVKIRCDVCFCWFFFSLFVHCQYLHCHWHSALCVCAENSRLRCESERWTRTTYWRSYVSGVVVVVFVAVDVDE